MTRLLLLLLVSTVAWWGVPATAAPAAKDPARWIADVAPGLVQVEFTLQFDRGDAPHGILDQDPKSTGPRSNSLADLVAEERPLETTGFLVGPTTVVAMDPCVHPRFIQSITVRQGKGRTSARISAYGVDQWAFVLTLDEPIAGTRPLTFPAKGSKGSEAAAGLVGYHRQDGQMVRVVLPFGGQFLQTESGKAFSVLDHQGLAVSAAGRPLGLVMNHRMDTEQRWRGQPLDWKWIDAAAFAGQLQELEALTARTLVRVRLSFRSPKATPGQNPMRMRTRGDEEADDSATERNELGVLLPGGRVAVLAALRSGVTARLERASIQREGKPPVPAKFVASLRDFGVLVVEPGQPLGEALRIDPVHPADRMGQLLLRAEIDLRGEIRSAYFHESRIAGVRVGARLEAYPELPDPEVKDTFLFTPDRALYALPVARRELLGGVRDAFAGRRQLTMARQIAEAVGRLPATADPANVPVSEADENRLAWLGVELQPLTRELARANKVSDQTRDGQTGALITYVHPESPAAKAGIQAGLVLLRLRAPSQPVPIEVQLEEDFARSQGFPWERLDEIRDQFFERIPTPWPPAETPFTRALTDLGFGTRFTAEFVEEGKLLSREFEVVPGPTHYESAARFKSESLGITVRNLTYDVRRYIQRKADEPGVVVSRIEPGGRASVAGVKPYELITHVQDQPVSTVADFERLVAAEKGDLKLTLKRMAKGRIVTIRAVSTESKE